MIQRHLFNAGNVIEYDSDDWRNCPCKNCITLTLHYTINALSISLVSLTTNKMTCRVLL